MKKYFIRYWPVLIIIILGLIPLSWFRSGYIIAGGDNSIYLDPSANLYNYSFSWFDKINSGVPNLQIPQIFPFSSFWSFGYAVGLSNEIIQRLWTIFHFILSGIFMYLLIKLFYKSSKKAGNIAGIVGAAFYMFNFLVITDAIQPVLRPVVAFLPLMFYLFVKGLDEVRFSVKYAILFALASLFYASSNINIANVVPIYLIMFVYWAYFIFSTHRIKHGLAFCLIILVTFLLVNSWWLVNFYFSVIKASNEVIGNIRSYDFLKSTFINEAFRTMGFWAFLQQFNGKTLLPFAMSYYRFPLILLTFLIPAMSFSSMLFKGRTDRKIFFSLLALFGIFISKGANHPFGFFYQYFYDKIPGFAVFREPFTKFTLIHVFAFSVLLGFFAEDFADFLLEKKKKIPQLLIPLLIIIIILLNSYPLLTGKNIQDETWYNDSRYSLYVKVPDYWRQAGEWFKKNNASSKVMLFPQIFYGHAYNWESGISSGAPVAMFFLPNPIICKPNAVANLQNSIAQIVYQLLYLGEKADLSPYLDLLAVDYVLQQNDVTANNEAGVIDPFTMDKILNKQNKLVQVIDFGSLNVFSSKSGEPASSVGTIPGLKVYKVKREIPSLQVYLTSKVVLVQGDEKSYPDIFSFYQYVPGENYLFFDGSEDLRINLNKLNINKQIFINFKNISAKAENTNYIYNFQIPRKGAYFLLANEYLFNPEFNKNNIEYFVRLNDKSTSSFMKSFGAWRKIELGELPEGNYELQTNLPVEEIKKEYLTSAFWVIGNNVFIENNSLDKDPEFSFRKINPSKYEVEVKRAANSYLLFLSEAYNSKWKIYYNNKQFAADHFIANGYANGWYIDPSKLDKKSYTFKLIYEPQIFSDIGTAVSSGAILIFIGYCLFVVLKKK